jgi:glycosyltransferase involved in cell wall biosynthesis
MTRFPKVLYVVSHWPGAPTYGGQQRVLEIGRLLKKVGSVSLVVVDENGHDKRSREKTEAEFNLARVITVKTASFKGLQVRLRHEFDAGYLHTRPYTVDPSECQAVLDLVTQHDLVWVHLIQTANILGMYHWPHSVLDMDNIPSRLYQSSARVASCFVRRMLDRRMSFIWKRRERKLVERFDAITVCSEDDRRYLGMDHVSVLPNGFQRLSNVERRPAQPPRLGFIGTFQWGPNVDGVRWFCVKVWPKIKEQLPDAELRIIGDATEQASGWGDKVVALGRVEDVGPEIATWLGMIVPIRTGGGTRIKVLEGFARKCPVITTKLGVFGYEINDREEAYIADEPDLFARHCIELMKSPQVGERMADRAYRRFLKCWTWDSYKETVRVVVETAMKKRFDVSP